MAITSTNDVIPSQTTGTVRPACTQCGRVQRFNTPTGAKVRTNGVFGGTVWATYCKVRCQCGHRYPFLLS